MQRAAARGEELWGPRPAALRKVLGDWIASRPTNGGHAGTGCAPDTIAFYEVKSSALRKVLGDNFDCNRLRVAQLENYITRRRDAGVSDQTIGKELGTLRAALRRGRRVGTVTVDLERVWPEFKPEYQARTRWLRPDELERLLQQLSPRRREVVELLVYTGARDSEWQRLATRHIDWRDKLLEVPGKKTQKAQRAIPFAEHPALAQLLRERSETRIGGRLFHRWTNIRRDLRAACERAKIPPCSPNDLRRTFGTWLRLAGVPVDRIARLLGHANSRLAEKVYGQLPPAAMASDIGRAFAHAVARGDKQAALPAVDQVQLERAVQTLLERIQAHSLPKVPS